MLVLKVPYASTERYHLSTGGTSQYWEAPFAGTKPRVAGTYQLSDAPEHKLQPHHHGTHCLPRTAWSHVEPRQEN
eukprot:3818666-Rhodomonas_salina.3